MPDQRTLPILGAVALGVLAGCSEGDTATGAPQPQPSTSAAPELPPRPAEVPIEGLDPCTTLTPAQQTELGTDAEPRISSQTDPNGNPACEFQRRAAPGYGYTVIPVPQEGAEVWLDGTRNVDVRVLDVVGFAAVETRLAGDLPNGFFCSVVIDVADGQSLDVQFTGIPESTHDEKCERATRAAELVMQTLLAR